MLLGCRKFSTASLWSSPCVWISFPG